MKKLSIILSVIIIFNIFISTTAFSNSLMGDPLAKPPQLSKQWDNFGFSLNLGGSYLTGNVNLVVVNSSVALNANYLNHSFYVEGSNMLQMPNYKPVLNKAQGSFLYTYGFHDNLNFYFSSSHNYNQFAKLDYRLSNGVGVCVHRFFDSFFNFFLISIGANYENEWFQGDVKDQAFTGAARLTFELPITDYVTLGSDFIFVPRFNDFSDFRIYEDAYLRFKLTDILAFQVSINDEYDSKPQEDVLSNDFGVFGSLIINFGF